MDERALLLLGMLKAQSQHGYQINEFIERNLSCITDMKKATAYAILERLSDAGFVSVHVEQEGNRPPRKVYAITPAGEEKFLTLLRENLSAADQMTLPGDIGLMFHDRLPRHEVVALLTTRLAQVEESLAAVNTTPGHHKHGSGINLALEHATVLLKAEREWLKGVMARLESEENG